MNKWNKEEETKRKPRQKYRQGLRQTDLKENPRLNLARLILNKAMAIRLGAGQHTKPIYRCKYFMLL